jgi:hypothetical protein
MSIRTQPCGSTTNSRIPFNCPIVPTQCPAITVATTSSTPKWAGPTPIAMVIRPVVGYVHHPTWLWRRRQLVMRSSQQPGILSLPASHNPGRCPPRSRCVATARERRLTGHPHPATVHGGCPNLQTCDIDRGVVMVRRLWEFSRRDRPHGDVDAERLQEAASFRK